MSSENQKQDILVQVCLGTNGIAAGGREVFKAFETALKENSIKAAVGQRECVRKTGCRGFCAKDVIVDITTPNLGKYSYAKVTPEMAPQIVQEHIINSQPIAKWVINDGSDKCEVASFMALQKRRVLKDCGNIDPEDINDYLARQGYSSLKKALDLKPSEVIDMVKESGLRGRGGAGFPVGDKWRACAAEKAGQKYIICNAQECDPGTFKDRSLLEGDPHLIIEGMCIASYAIGATKGIICVNPDYKLAYERLNMAVQAAAEKGILGGDMMGSRHSLNIEVMRGVTTFSCGESTALINTIEGKRGYPRLTPPHTAEAGLWGCPTIVNNVETLANIPMIIADGPANYASIGTVTSKGTKVFGLAGAVKNVGLIEVPMGTTLKQIVFDIGGGAANKKLPFKAVQVGGPLGGCYSEKELDVTVDYETLTRYNSTIGSGGMVVLDSRTCIVDFAKHLLNFAQEETCGKCAPCRIGTEVMFEILDRISKGEGKESDLQELHDLGEDIHDFALCGLGKMAPNPVLTAIKNFREEFEAHIIDKTCPSRVCQSLLKYIIDEKACAKCGICFKKACKFEAIKWAPKETAEILKDKCTKCGACVKVCPFMAIY